MKSTSPPDMCRMFSDFFQSTYNTNARPPSTAITNATDTILPEEIETLLSKLDENKHGVPDGIPNIFVRRTCKYLSIALFKIFNKSLISGTIPNKFKMALVTPIHRKDKKTEVSNYRRICLLNVFSKMLERLVHDSLQLYLVDKLDKHHHGFIKNRSTLTHLTHYDEYISRSLAEGLEVHAIYTFPRHLTLLILVFFSEC